MSDLEAFLTNGTVSGAGKRPRRCQTCSQWASLDGDIREFLRRKETGETHLPVYSSTGARCLLSYLATRGYDCDGRTLVRHISNCMRIDHKTGKAL